MYINFWYPMAKTDELGEQPLKVRALGLDFALFRDSAGAVHCVADVCIHRGGSLAGGKVVGDCIQCPYHGWQYDGTGACRKIPTLGDDERIPGRARVDSYPVVERYGLVFAFLGDLPESERPPMLEVREWGQEGWSITNLQYPWEANYERVIENGLDATHTEFVHPAAGLSGNFKPHDDLETRLDEFPYGSAFVTNSPTLQIEHGHLGACHQWTFLGFKYGDNWTHFNFYSFVRPIDHGQVMRYLFMARDFQHGEKMDEEIVRTNWGFEGEDHAVIRDLRPRLSPRQQRPELLLPEDEIMLRYRRYLDEWQGRGWRIDTRRIAGLGDDHVHVVPSPARRESRNWVIPAVPLVRGDAPVPVEDAATG